MSGRHELATSPLAAGVIAHRPGRDLLLEAYRGLGRSLNLHRNAVAAVCLAVPSLARTAVLVLAFDLQRARWWMASGAEQDGDPSVAASGSDRDDDGAVADLPDWIRTILSRAESVRVHPVPRGRRRLPDGGEHEGHGMAVRLTCSYQCQGVLALLRDAGQPEFTETDRSLAVEFGAATGRAVTAALLYHDQVQVADTLRAALLPAPLPEVDGIELAAVYRPAREALRIGGDMVHVEPLTSGGAFYALGDVCGKGIEAAVAGNRLRQSLRVLCRITGQPRDILNLLNDATFDPDATEATQFATLILGVVQPSAHGGALVRLAGGGHPPPLMVRRTGTVKAIRLGGMMLGVASPATFAEAAVWLAPGDFCVLYTDGLIDAEGGPHGRTFGTDRLAALLAEYADMPAALVAERIDQRIGDWLAATDHDDIAALVIRARQRPGHR
ncbi:PP2C family protein-serine/threonine phosphatase [Actinoplanes utahensis]|uniref:PP2C family protein-serine/threonine phosphatase n=1 Tax=Actinoplanes utahensis TaxID=1869 RepID=UPI00068B174C|nr:PP2C family protein-serine/threonine phosphatase [Actinoplanes utahensis]GIF28801.1 histidine kinase [Actinoplanes utahensis]